MPEWLTILLVYLGLQLVFVLILQTFPNLLGNALAKKVKHSFDLKLEKARAEMHAAYSTLQTSVDFLSAGHPQYRAKTIEAVEALWSAILTARNEFDDLMTVYGKLDPEEIDRVIKGEEIYENVRGLREGFLARIHAYQEASALNERFEQFKEIAPESLILFSGDRLWKRYFTILRSYMRLAIHMHYSIKRLRYIDWREQTVIMRAFEMELSPDIIKEAKEGNNLRSLLVHLENAFLREARRVMSGSEALAEALSDMQATMQIERERISRDQLPR